MKKAEVKLPTELLFEFHKHQAEFYKILYGLAIDLIHKLRGEIEELKRR